MAGVRGLLRDLRTGRYLALSVLMVLVALICVSAGTWQIARYDGKHAANGDLRGNARADPQPVGDVLPISGAGPTENAVEFRTVTATGTYDPAAQVLVRRRQVSDTNGYLVLTPLRTPSATLLVVRGFIADTSSTPAPVAAPPTGQITVRGRAFGPETGDDKFASLGNGQVERIVPHSVASRLATAVYDGYVELDADQPGTAGITAIPGPDLSNPAGGAIEPQHLAYIVQWYLFATLALAAPVVMVRTDRKRAEEDAIERAGAVRRQEVPATVDQRLADRYGRTRT